MHTKNNQEKPGDGEMALSGSEIHLGNGKKEELKSVISLGQFIIEE